MEKNEKKLLIIGIIIAGIILIILIVFGIIYYLGIINKNNQEVEINRKGKETATVPADKNFVEDRDENVIKSNGNINNTTVKDLRNICLVILPSIPSKTFDSTYTPKTPNATFNTENIVPSTYSFFEFFI